MKLMEDVYQVGGPSLSHRFDATAYLLPGLGNDLVLIDCGAPEGAALIAQNIRALGFDPGRITRIYATHGHYDHVGGAGFFDAPLYLHALDQEQVAQGDDRRSSAALLYGRPMPALAVEGNLAEGDAFSVRAGRVRVLHTPGHSPGSCCFLLSHRSGLSVLFAGDCLFGGFSPAIGSDEQAWRASLERLCQEDIDCFTFGHCPPSLLCDAKRRLQSLKQSFANYYNPWFKDFYREYPY